MELVDVIPKSEDNTSLPDPKDKQQILSPTKLYNFVAESVGDCSRIAKVFVYFFRERAYVRESYSDWDNRKMKEVYFYLYS